MPDVAWATLRTPVGPISLSGTDQGVTSIKFGTAPAKLVPPGAQAELLAAAGAQLAEYFSGQRQTFEVPLDWSALSDLQRQVLVTLYDSVPFGKTVTYGDLARRSGVEDAGHDLPARTIGQVMGSNPYPVIVPCHRVVAADGLGGYSGGTGIEIKRWLLIFEGVEPPTLDWSPDGPATASR
jgi:methylated-DNA-[protein]-cysteine S-methyltransferase